MLEELNLGVKEDCITTIVFEYHSSSYIDPCDEIETCFHDCTMDIILKTYNDNKDNELQFIGRVKMKYYNIALFTLKLLQGKCTKDDLLNSMIVNPDFKVFFDSKTDFYSKKWKYILRNFKNSNLLAIESIKFDLALITCTNELCRAVINELCHHFWSSCGIIAVDSRALSFTYSNLDKISQIKYILEKRYSQSDIDQICMSTFTSLEDIGLTRYNDTSMFYLLLDKQKLIMNQ